MSRVLWEITIPWDASTLSGNSPLHPMVHRRILKQGRAAAEAVWRQQHSPVLDVPLTVHIVVRRARPMDDYRILAGTECLRDALFAKRRYEAKHLPPPPGRKRHMVVERGLMVPDDSPQWVKLGRVEQVTAPEHRGRETVTFIIEAREP